MILRTVPEWNALSSNILAACSCTSFWSWCHFIPDIEGCSFPKSVNY